MKKFKLIAGPCVIENLMTPMRVASDLQRICDKLNIDYIFKSSYVKANRTHKDSFQTIGIKDALGVLGTLKEMGHTILTDVHESNDVHIDPEVSAGGSISGTGVESYQLPPTRTIGFKLNFKF